MSGVHLPTIPKEPFISWDYFSILPGQRRWLGSGGSRERLSFFWARNGIYHALRALRISPGAHVLAPAYICTAAVEPLTAYSARVEFYEIGRDCQPHLSEIESRIGPQTEAILAVHYFGFPQRIGALRELCDRHRLALIEDCAHVVCGEADGAPLGAHGDASVFSWRKFLPLYDGAELRLNRLSASLEVQWNRERIPFTLKVAKCLSDRVLDQSSSEIARSVARALELAKRVWRRAGSVPPDQPLVALDSNQASLDLSLLNQRISRVSRFVLEHSDIPAVIKQRRENYAFLHEGLRNVDGIHPLHAELPEQVCPWVYPLLFDGIMNAHLLLRDMEIPAVTWGGVRPKGLDARLYPHADFLYDNLVFLPVHQNLGKEALQQIVEASKKVAASGTDVRHISRAVAMQTSR